MTLTEWKELAKRDDCFGHLVPSDLRKLIARLEAAEEFIKEFDDAFDPYKIPIGSGLEPTEWALSDFDIKCLQEAREKLKQRSEGDG